ncbi:hypothetical protein Pint_07321 [Pistacia integerrima]|uniref:Uncharacterized protein n=1 Tax=Pistacia integerrima TaxID=434235 RepID=A0ACC0XSF8_9ROSI|nr:hypothetical protein Pint_07321 [Pistacia integerrima]
MVGTFMGGLKAEIANGIRMFKPQSLRDTINLARMRDDQLSCQRRNIRTQLARGPLTLPQDTRGNSANSSVPICRYHGMKCRIREHKVFVSISINASPQGISTKSPSCCFWKGMWETWFMKISPSNHHQKLITIEM